MVSVIITCFNLEKYIGRAIESVLEQTYTGAIEIIVVDDGSTDCSADIIRSFPQVRYLGFETNVGVLMATVAGIEASSGEHVFFLDGDDLWAPEKIDACLVAFKASPACNLVTHDLIYINESGNPVSRQSRSAEELSGLGADAAGMKVKRGILLHSDYVWLGSAYCLERQKANLEGFCAFARNLPDAYNTYQDWPLAYWAACQPGSCAGYVPQKLVQYRLHDSNYSGDATNKTKAVRNFKRAHNTIVAIKSIVEMYCCDRRAVKATRQKLRYTSYLDDLYSDHAWSAIKNFFLNLFCMGFSPIEFAKEFVRLTGILFFGVERFIRIKNSYRRKIG